MSSHGGEAKFHQWVNSAGVIVAIFLSSFSTYYSWQTSRLKYEDVTPSVLPNDSCKAEYQKLGSAGLLGLCWTVTLSNKSENRLSLVEGHIFGVSDQGVIDTWTNALTPVENLDGSPFNFPITLDGGESKRFLVRAPVQVPTSVAKVLNDLSGTDANPLAGMALRQVGNTLALHGLDYLGDSIDVILDSGKIAGWQVKPPYKSTTNVWEVQTGRGAKFLAFLVWPPSR